MSLTLVLSLYALFFPFYSQPNRTADQGLFLLKKIKFIWIQIDLYKDATNPKNNFKKKRFSSAGHQIVGGLTFTNETLPA